MRANVRIIGRFVMIKFEFTTCSEAPYDPPVNTTAQRSLLSVELEKLSINCKNGFSEMGPEEMNTDVSMASEDVFKLTPTAPTVADPIVSPLSVNVNAEAPIVAPDVVMTTDVTVVAPHVAISPATLLAPAATAGVTDGAKKPEG
jgi:hypothetical protein